MTEHDAPPPPPPPADAPAPPAPVADRPPDALEAASAAPVEPLAEAELVSDDRALLDALRARRAGLEAIPDGPRPAAPGSERPRWRRKTYVVDWKLQLDYASVYIATIALLVLGFVVLNFIFYFFAQRMLALHRTGRIPEAESFHYYMFANAIFVVLLAIGMSLYAIIQSHRVAGPALRLRRALRQMLGRDYDFHLQLRRADYLQDLAEQVNALNVALKARDLVAADAALRLDEAARELEADGADAGAVRDAARALAEAVVPPEPPGDDQAP